MCIHFNFIDVDEFYIKRKNIKKWRNNTVVNENKLVYIL